VNSGSVVPRFWAPDFWRYALKGTT